MILKGKVEWLVVGTHFVTMTSFGCANKKGIWRDITALGVGNECMFVLFVMIRLQVKYIVLPRCIYVMLDCLSRYAMLPGFANLGRHHMHRLSRGARAYLDNHMSC